MGRKSAAKGQGSGSGKPAAPAKGKGGLFAAIAAVVVIAGLGIAFWGPAGSADPSQAKSDPTSTVTPEIEAKVKAAAAVGPRKQAQLPPIPFQGYQPPRPPEVITAAYQFAAEHPEVLSYVPCFCGCQHS